MAKKILKNNKKYIASILVKLKKYNAMSMETKKKRDLDYYCPHCKTKLNQAEVSNPKGYIHFWVKNYQGQWSTIFVNPELGNYEVIKDSNFQWKKGEVLEILCPYCKQDLSLSQGSLRAKILAKDRETQEEMMIIFSKIIGEHLTYIMDMQERRVIDSYGEHANDPKELWDTFIW